MGHCEDGRGFVEEKHPAALADLDGLPEGVKGEIIDDVLYAQPRPRGHHQRIIGALVEALTGPFDFGRGGPGGWWILPEPGITLPSAPEFFPDVGGWQKARLSEIPTDRAIDVVPDWVCEVLSTSTRAYDLVVKRAFYARIGVGHLWYVDAEANAVMVSRLQSGRWVEVAVFGGGAKMKAEPFEILEVDMAAWWPATKLPPL